MPKTPTKPKSNPLKTCRSYADLAKRLATINPDKIAAYRKFREPSQTNIHTAWDYKYRGRIWKRDPLVIEAPRASYFHWPPRGGKPEFSNNGQMKWEQDGFSIVVRKKIDEHCELQLYGELWDARYDTRERPKRVPDDAIPMAHDHHGYPRCWFRPNMSMEEELENLQGCYGKHEKWLRARHRVLWNFERVRAYGDSWWAVGLEARVHKDGIELGSAAIWGFEDDDEFGLNEGAHDVAGEALSEAKAAFSELIATATKEHRYLRETYLLDLNKGQVTFEAQDGSSFNIRAGTQAYFTPLFQNKDSVNVLIAIVGQPTQSATLSHTVWDRLVAIIIKRTGKDDQDRP